MKIEHTKEFDLAYRFVTETNQNIFLTGKAGTGKTTFLKYLRQNSIKRTVVAAPTGVAAINANGVTLHSLFQLPLGIILPNSNLFRNPQNLFLNNQLISKLQYSKEKFELLRSIDLLIIDEASMLPSYIVDAIDVILRYVRKKPESPFGGVQLLLIGDLHQLPPVVKREDWEILQEYYSSIFFFDSFVLRDNQPIVIELKEIFRQRDEKFIEILNGIRNDDISEENFRLLNSRLQRHFKPQDNNDGYIILTTHNYQSEEINRRKLTNLPSLTHTYQAEILGEFPENIFPAEEKLELKVGAQVMFLKNDTEGKKYFNGKIGVVTRLDEESIWVKCNDSYDEILVKKNEWQNISYTIDAETRELKEEVIGVFSQFPLRLAWSITIHKSQGLTFEKVIVDAEKAFAIGQVYVALSRCTSLEGLILSTPVYRNFLGAHEDLIEWQRKSYVKNLEQLFNELRHNFILEEIQNIFTWKDWEIKLKELSAFLNENQIKTSPEGLLWILDLTNKQKELTDVAEKFKHTIVRLSKATEQIEKNENLQKRIIDGANYFYDEICKWLEKFTNHPLAFEIKKLARKIDYWLEEITLIVRENLYNLTICKNGFILENYLNSRKSFSQTKKGIRSSYSKEESELKIEKDIPNIELYHKLIELRKQIRKETSLPNYLIFNNNSIKNVCVSLPLTKEELMQVKGFKEVKVAAYGDRIITAVKEYCRLNNIKRDRHEFDEGIKKNKSAKQNTVLETIQLFRKGKCIEEIAQERELVVGTIERHLAEAIKQSLIRIDEVMPLDEVKKIAEYFPEELNEVRLASIKEKVPEDVTYGKLRMVLAWLMKETY